jgi:uncharacterized protein (DUF362 family)
MDRRKFLKSIVKTAVIATATTKLPKRVFSAEGPIKTTVPDLVGVRNGQPVEMFRKGIEALGGMQKFVKPGQKVVIKPNSSFDAAEERASNTNPNLIGEIVRQVKAAGAAEISVFDHTLNEWRASYKNSGIQKAVEDAGGKMLPANDESFYQELKRPTATLLKASSIFKPLLQADVFINVPTLKNHGGAKMSAAIKNLMGIVWDRWVFHRTDLNRSIAEILLYKKPDLTIIDAYRVLIANGPRGVSVEDVKLMKYQILSTDIVAADTVALNVIGYKLTDVPYISMAEKLGAGTTNLSRLNILRIDAGSKKSSKTTSAEA